MFRFTIRDVLWLLMVVGLSLGWYLHYQRLTRPPKLYRDEEIQSLIVNNSRIIVDEFSRLLIVPAGKSMPLSQVFKTLGIDPNRVTDFRHGKHNMGVSLYWQVSPSYDLICETTDED